MTTLEIVLCFVSVAETIITVVLHRRIKKKLDKEREMFEAKRMEYEKLIAALPIGRGLL